MATGKLARNAGRKFALRVFRFTAGKMNYRRPRRTLAHMDSGMSIGLYHDLALLTDGAKRSRFLGVAAIFRAGFARGRAAG